MDQKRKFMIGEKKETLNGLEFQRGLISPAHTCGVFIGLSVDRCGKSSTALFACSQDFVAVTDC